jgi:hypothetical protein
MWTAPVIAARAVAVVAHQAKICRSVFEGVFVDRRPRNHTISALLRAVIVDVIEAEEIWLGLTAAFAFPAVKLDNPQADCPIVISGIHAH